MFTRILSAIPDGSRRFPLRYVRMVNSITDRMYLAKSRYLLAHPIQTPGMELLRNLILNLDIANLDTFESDIDRYTEVIKFFRVNYRNSFDPVYSGSILGGKWIARKNEVPPLEILLNCECAAPMDELPFDKDWVEWQDLRAFRLVYHDSLELPEDFAMSMIHFKSKLPTLLVVSLDVPILLFKYYKYVKNCQESHLQPNASAFLKDNEYSNFFDDLYEIWTLNLFQYIFDHPTAKTDEVIAQVAMPVRFCTDNMLRQGIDGIFEFVSLAKSGAFQLKDFLETRWFLEGSLKNKISELGRWITLPDNHKYLWLNTLKWLPYIRLLLSVLKLYEDAPIATTVRLRCYEVWVKHYRYVQVYNVTPSETIKTFIADLNSEIKRLLAN